MKQLKINRVTANINCRHWLGSSHKHRRSFIKLPRILAILETRLYFEKAGKVLVSTNKFEETLLRKEFDRLNPVK